MLENILSQFNNREYAVIFWLGLFFTFALSKKDIRKSLFELIFQKFLIQILFVLTFYNLLITVILLKIGIWNIDYLKESLYWFFGSSLVFFFNIEKVDGGIKFIIDIVFKMFSFTAILAFIGNVYTFSFIMELILQPFLFLLTLMIAFGESYKDKNPKYSITVKFLNYILLIIIILILTGIIFGFLKTPTKLISIENIIFFLYPIIYITFFYPFLYLFRLLMNYEGIFVRIKIKNNSRFFDYIYVKWKIFSFCGINLKKINNFSRGRSFWMENKEGINVIIKEFNNGKV